MNDDQMIERLQKGLTSADAGFVNSLRVICNATREQTAFAAWSDAWLRARQNHIHNYVCAMS